MAISAPSTRAAVWAESGQTTTPSQGEQQSGFVTGKPPRHKMNWLLNWLDNAVQWILQLGLPEYDAGRTYYPKSKVSYGDYGWGYIRIGEGTTTGAAPTDTSKWMRWGHTDEEVNELIDDKIGDVSGSLAEGTITPSGSATVGYCRALRFPNSTEKVVYCRLTIPSGAYSATLTLSGAAAFESGADGAVAQIADTGSNTVSGATYTRATVVNETTVSVTVNGFTSVDALVIEVQIRGH